MQPYSKGPDNTLGAELLDWNRICVLSTSFKRCLSPRTRQISHLALAVPKRSTKREQLRAA